MLCLCHCIRLCLCHSARLCSCHYVRLCLCHYDRLCPCHYVRLCPFHYVRLCPCDYVRRFPCPMLLSNELIDQTSLLTRLLLALFQLPLDLSTIGFQVMSPQEMQIISQQISLQIQQTQLQVCNCFCN